MLFAKLERKTFCFLEERLLSIWNFVLSSNVLVFFFTSCWLAHNQLSWNVLLFSGNPIGQLCLSSPSYSSRTVKLSSLRLAGCPWTYYQWKIWWFVFPWVSYYSSYCYLVLDCRINLSNPWEQGVFWALFRTIRVSYLSSVICKGLWHQWKLKTNRYSQ